MIILVFDVLTVLCTNTQILFLMIDVFPSQTTSTIGSIDTASSIVRVPIAYRRRSDPPKPIV
jgi:hypothetical protein